MANTATSIKFGNGEDDFLIVEDTTIGRIGDNDKLNLILDSLQITELSIILKEHNINIKNYEILEYNTINKIIFFVNSI